MDPKAKLRGRRGGLDGHLPGVVGRPDPGGGTALDESFDAGISGTWTIVDGRTAPHTWYADDATDALGCASTDPAAPSAGSWAAVDSDCAAPVAGRAMGRSAATTTTRTSSGTGTWRTSV